MREIKFRAWDRNRKNWITIRLDQGQALTISEGTHNRVDLEQWQQFTGLKDKNGKEIYEGDILSHKYRNGLTLVEWKLKEAQWSIGGFQSDDKEVIGNIYENPELHTDNLRALSKESKALKDE